MSRDCVDIFGHGVEVYEKGLSLYVKLEGSSVLYPGLDSWVCVTGVSAGLISRGRDIGAP